MSNKFDRRAFLSRTTGSLLATSMLPGVGLAGTGAFDGSASAQSASGHTILTPEHTGIFPRPHEMKEAPGFFPLNEESSIILPRGASENDVRLARFLIEELSDHYDVQPRVLYENELPQNGRFILMGSISNPLVRDYCRTYRPDVSAGLS